MSKEKDLLEKYVGNGITEKAAKELISGDTTPTKKYAQVMITHYIFRKKSSGGRGVKDIITLFQKFDSLLPYIEKKDIYNNGHYPNLDSINSAVKKAEEVKEEKTFNREDHVDVLIENDDYILVHPFTLRGSQKYGKNTRWCTATSNKHNNYFDSYKKNNFLFYLIRKKLNNNQWDKVAFCLDKRHVLTGSISVFCALDSSQNTQSMENSDWSLTSWVTIMSLCRAFAVEETRKQKELNKIKSYVESAKKIVNVDEIIEAMTSLNQKPSQEVVSLMKECTDLLSSFTNKIKTINKNGKFVTENEG
jgi:hypothetical protein